MIRHGEILFVPVKKIPKLESTKTTVIMKGQTGNSHLFDNGSIFLKEVNQYVFGYFKAKNTTLFHPEHGKDGKAKLPDGLYELRRQVEYTPNGLVPVID